MSQTVYWISRSWVFVQCQAFFFTPKKYLNQYYELQVLEPCLFRMLSQVWGWTAAVAQAILCGSQTGSAVSRAPCLPLCGRANLPHVYVNPASKDAHIYCCNFAICVKSMWTSNGICLWFIPKTCADPSTVMGRQFSSETAVLSSQTSRSSEMPHCWPAWHYLCVTGYVRSPVKNPAKLNLFQGKKNNNSGHFRAI